MTKEQAAAALAKVVEDVINASWSACENERQPLTLPS